MMMKHFSESVSFPGVVDNMLRPLLTCVQAGSASFTKSEQSSYSMMAHKPPSTLRINAVSVAHDVH